MAIDRNSMQAQYFSHRLMPMKVILNIIAGAF